MNIHTMRVCGLMAGITVLLLNAADQPAGAAGHWDGTLHGQTPTGQPQDIPIAVDLAPNPSGGWRGSIDLQVKGLELSDIAVNGSSVHFAIRNAPGNPSFDAKLSADGGTMTGDATQQGGPKATFTLTRAGAARVAEPPKSTPISKSLEGTWQGTLEPQGQTLHLLLDLTAAADGTGSGTLTSVDQGNTRMALSQVTQKGDSVSFGIRLIDGAFEGQLNASGTELKGTWTQGQTSLPLTLTKQAAK